MNKKQMIEQLKTTPAYRPNINSRPVQEVKALFDKAQELGLFKQKEEKVSSIIEAMTEMNLACVMRVRDYAQKEIDLRRDRK